MQKDNTTQSDHTWPAPNRRFAMRMSWHDLLFAHWPVDAEQVQSQLPSGLQVDTWDGTAWIAVVPFRMTDVAPRGIPAIPGMSAFPELNVRTYVTVDNKPGVWFFSLDATNRIAVRIARFAFHLPYMDAKMSIQQKTVGTTTKASAPIATSPRPNLLERIGLPGRFFMLSKVRSNIGSPPAIASTRRIKRAKCYGARSIIHLGPCNKRN